MFTLYTHHKTLLNFISYRINVWACDWQFPWILWNFPNLFGFEPLSPSQSIYTEQSIKLCLPIQKIYTMMNNVFSSLILSFALLSFRAEREIVTDKQRKNHKKRTRHTKNAFLSTWILFVWLYLITVVDFCVCLNLLCSSVSAGFYEHLTWANIYESSVRKIIMWIEHQCRNNMKHSRITIQMTDLLINWRFIYNSVHYFDSIESIDVLSQADSSSLKWITFRRFDNNTFIHSQNIEITSYDHF